MIKYQQMTVLWYLIVWHNDKLDVETALIQNHAANTARDPWAEGRNFYYTEQQ
jgi:hypothetical protein